MWSSRRNDSWTVFRWKFCAKLSHGVKFSSFVHFSCAELLLLFSCKKGLEFGLEKSSVWRISKTDLFFLSSQTKSLLYSLEREWIKMPRKKNASAKAHKTHRESSHKRQKKSSNDWENKTQRDWDVKQNWLPSISYMLHTQWESSIYLSFINSIAVTVCVYVCAYKSAVRCTSVYVFSVVFASLLKKCIRRSFFHLLFRFNFRDALGFPVVFIFICSIVFY